jgi:inner membrane protein
MDSLSQIVLGCAVAEATLGKKIGNHAILWGAILGTVPDLDVLSQNFTDEFHALTLHRGFSHSIIFTFLIAFIMGWILKKIYRKNSATYKDWFKMTFWVVITHIGLDCLTSWGTQVFWPHPWRVSTNSIFVADPLYTLPFLITIILLMFFKRTNPTRSKINKIGLVLSSTYLLMGLLVKIPVNAAFKDNYKNKGIEVIQFKTRPTPLNILLWTANAEVEDGYYLGYYSIMDENNDIDLYFIPKNDALLDPIREDKTVQRVLEMTQGNYAVYVTDSCYFVNDLRFGQPEGWESDENEFVFQYHLYDEEGGVRVDVPEPPRPEWDQAKIILGSLFRRALGDKSALNEP